MKNDKPLNERFIRVVYELAKRIGKKDIDIYKSINISYQSKSNIENGHQNVSINILMKISEKYPYINMNYIYYGDEAMFRGEDIDPIHHVSESQSTYSKTADKIARVEDTLVSVADQLRQLMNYERLKASRRADMKSIRDEIKHMEQE